MRFLRRKFVWLPLLVVTLYAETYAGIKIVRPSFLTSNDGPGRWYCGVFYPLRYATATRPTWYWRSLSRGRWLTAKVVWNNLGNGRLSFDLPEGPQGAFAGWDLNGAEEGEVADLNFSFELVTWDDFSDHLFPSVDDVKRNKPNQAPEPTPPRVTPAAVAPVAPRSVAARL